MLEDFQKYKKRIQLKENGEYMDYECPVCRELFDSGETDDFNLHLIMCITIALMKSEHEKEIEFTYLAQPPKRYTFQQPKLKEWIEKYCKGNVLNLFAGIVKLNVNEIRVDIDKNVSADYCMDAYDFVNMAIEKDMKFDTIVLDPPYNLRKSREKYGGRYIGSFTKIKEKLPLILSEKGIVITLGYDSVGMARCRGFEKIAICLICHNGDHNDTICLVERKL